MECAVVSLAILYSCFTSGSSVSQSFDSLRFSHSDFASSVVEIGKPRISMVSPAIVMPRSTRGSQANALISGSGLGQNTSHLDVLILRRVGSSSSCRRS
jgi:hypothetical protein